MEIPDETARPGAAIAGRPHRCLTIRLSATAERLERGLTGEHGDPILCAQG